MQRCVLVPSTVVNDRAYVQVPNVGGVWCVHCVYTLMHSCLGCDPSLACAGITVRTHPLQIHTHTHTLWRTSTTRLASAAWSVHVLSTCISSTANTGLWSEISCSARPYCMGAMRGMSSCTHMPSVICPPVPHTTLPDQRTRSHQAGARIFLSNLLSYSDVPGMYLYVGRNASLGFEEEGSNDNKGARHGRVPCVCDCA